MMGKNKVDIVPVYIRSDEKQKTPLATTAVNQVACSIKKDGIEFILYNDAEMAIVYEVMREVFGHAG